MLIDLPNEILYHISDYLSSKDIKNTLLSDDTIKERLNNDDFFIYKRLIHDFGNEFPYIKGYIQEIDMNHGKLLYLGQQTKKILKYKAKSLSARGGRLAFISFDNSIRIVKSNIETSMLSEYAFKLISVAQWYVIAVDLNDYILKIKRKSGPPIGRNVKDRQDIIKIGQVLNSKQIACGDDHTLIVDSDNNLWGFGNNRRHQLFGLSRIVSDPTKIDLPFKVKFVACGSTSNMLIDIDDNLSTSGYHEDIGLCVIPRIDVSNQRFY